MTLDTYKSVLKLCPLLLRPVIRILLKAGVNYKQFSKIAREVYVDAASNDFDMDNKKSTTPRVAILTGISRSEVTKIREFSKNNHRAEIPISSLNSACRLLSAWHTDTDYLDSKGQPISLKIDGPEPNFKTLMHKYGDNNSSSAMLKELQHAEAVKIDTDESIVPLQRAFDFTPAKFNQDRIFSIIEDFVDFGTTSHKNFVRENNEESQVQLKVYNSRMKPESAPDFKKMLREKTYQFATEIDEWLSKNQCQNTVPDEENEIKLGLGMYLIEDTEQKTKT